GFAIGGVAVGEPHEEMMKAIEYTIPYLPEIAPKHLLGVGTPFDIVQGIARGCDTFDCVIPTREARHGRLYIAARSEDGKEGYQTIDIRLEKHKEDFTPIDTTCNCYACLNHTRAYMRHLFASGEMLGTRLATMHNLRFYLNMMEKIRNAIQYEYFGDMLADFKDYTGKTE
ncbi:MAG: tRNA-guanine transglycosylase, partial [bacterium]|nr:tRNA-guanine transglycosylase [bacterium]